MSFQKKGTRYRTMLIVCSLLLSILLAACGGSSTGNSSNSNSSNSNTSEVPNTAEQERKTRMQHYMVQQEQQTFDLQEDMQPFIAEISTMPSLAEEAGVAGHLLVELDVFKHQVEHLDASAWERKEVRFLKRNELARLSLAVLRAYRSRSC